IRNGFARATTTIVDANVTTLITAVVLYTIGTDQIQGFAVVLFLGVVLSMFTAIFCSRVIFDIAERKRWITKLRMMRIVGKTNIDFLSMRYAAGIISVTVIAIGLVAVVVRGKGLLDIDFTGGTSVGIVFNERISTDEVRVSLDVLPDLAVSNVEIEGEPEDMQYVINTSERDIEAVEKQLKETFAERLATNSLTVSDLKAVEEAPPKSTMAPDKTDQGRNDLPTDSLLAAADTASLLLAQTEPTEDQAAEKPEPK
ncbi:unnamed protein product, partial [marine sediment metagenome]